MKEIYSKIFKLMEDNADSLCFDIDKLKYKADLHLYKLGLEEDYGFIFNEYVEIHNRDYCNIGDYLSLNKWSDSKSIGIEDNGKRPDNEELLFIISFPTGAYIFGEDYPTTLFLEFFEELKDFNPKYLDSANKTLYFSMENAGVAHNSFKSILKKYHDINKKQFKERKILKLKKELELLQ